MTMSGVKIVLYSLAVVLVGLLLGGVVFAACTAAVLDVPPAEPSVQNSTR